MSGKYEKKIRKVVNKKIRTDMEGLARKLSEEKLWWRFIYAIRIIFRWHPEIKFETKKHG